MVNDTESLDSQADVIVCRCEGVTWRSVQEAMEQLHPTSLRQLKLMTRWGMGMCQGRVCRPLMAATLLPEAASREVRLAVHPPFKPVTMGSFGFEGDDGDE